MNTKTAIAISLVLVAIGVAGRLMPHVWNFAPIVAIGLFSGAYLGKRWAFLIPVAAMFISDAVIGFYDWKINLVVYAAMALSGVIGLCLRSQKTPVPIALASMAGSTSFFLITNAAVWYFGSSYSPGIDGLFASLTAGLPFFRNALMGDMWYSFILFGAYALVVAVVKRQKQLIKVRS